LFSNFNFSNRVILFYILKLFGIDEFVGDNRWAYVFGILILYGMSHISQMYLFSNYFKVSATGFAALVAWNIISSKNEKKNRK